MSRLIRIPAFFQEDLRIPRKSLRGYHWTDAFMVDHRCAKRYIRRLIHAVSGQANIPPELRTWLLRRIRQLRHEVMR